MLETINVTVIPIVFGANETACNDLKKETGNQRKNTFHPDHITVKVSLNSQKIPEESYCQSNFSEKPPVKMWVKNGLLKSTINT